MPTRSVGVRGTPGAKTTAPDGRDGTVGRCGDDSAIGLYVKGGEG